jgi:hypothetical protein
MSKNVENAFRQEFFSSGQFSKIIFIFICHNNVAGIDVPISEPFLERDIVSWFKFFNIKPVKLTLIKK